MLRDVARNRLPRGAAWTIQDYIPEELGAPLVKRGGWSYQSGDLTGVMGTADRVVNVFYAPLAAPQLCAVVRDDGGGTQQFVTIASTSSATARGSTRYPKENLTFYRGRVFITDNAGSSAPQQWDGSNLNTVGGSPPTGSASCVYKDRLVLASSNTDEERLWFSAPGDPASWDTTNSWIDTSEVVRAVYQIRNSILIFHGGSIERIIGSTPPPGSDMYLQPMSDIGTIYAKSLAGTDEFCCFANASGVYYTDGSALVDLTEQGGMRSHWQSNFTGSGREVSGGYARGYYFVSVADSSTPSAGAVTYMIHIRSRRWVTINNLNAGSYNRSVGLDERLYFGDLTEARVGSCFPDIFFPSASTKADADGTAVTPILETPYYELGFSRSRVRRAYLQYDVRDSASDNPTLSLSYVTSPESTSYTTATPSSVGETTAMEQAQFSVGKKAFGVGFKIAQTNASSATRLGKVGIEGHPREDSRSD